MLRGDPLEQLGAASPDDDGVAALVQGDGLVSTYLVEAPGGPPRKYYRLTETGRKTLTAQREEWKSFMAAVENMLGDGS